ncbi:MAG: glycosyltransferase [Pseudohongiella sp.]|nr:glycosyltransferase [Pseudohongiella sp.]
MKKTENQIPGEHQQPGRIKLLKVVTSFLSGGTEGQVDCLAKAIDRTVFDLGFACLHKEGPFLEELERLNISVKEFPIGKFSHPKTYVQQLKLAMYMKSEKVQISHSYNFYSNLVAVPAAKMAGVPVVIASIRDRGVYLTPMQKRVQRWTCSMADLVLVNAEAIRDWLIDQGVPAAKISVIKNGLELSSYQHNDKSPSIREELGIESKSRLVAMLSRLNPQKGVEEFLHAAVAVSNRHADVNFLVVGEKLGYKDGAVTRDSEYHEHLQSLADSLGIAGRVSFTGHRNDVSNILPQCDLSVLPSHSEGLSNALIESMAASLPIVATDVGGNPELVKHNVNGFLVPVQDATALAAAINRILDDPKMAACFGFASRQLCEEQFSTVRMAALTQQLYKSEIQKRSHPHVVEKTN